MKVEELQKLYSGKELAVNVKVRVEGYLYGFEYQNFPNTEVKNGMIEASKGDETFYTAIVQFPEGQTMSFHKDGFGTTGEMHRIGGGKLWIPIHAVELT